MYFQRRRSLQMLAALPVLSTTRLAWAAPSSVNLAMIGEPQSLDPMASTADLVGTIMQHVFETLYTFDANWRIVPMLAESMPQISSDGLSYRINLRKGVKFHHGRDLEAQDVLASLERWMEMAPRGKAMAANTQSLEVRGPLQIEWRLKTPNAPLLAHLALPTGMAAIMAKDSIANPLAQFVGTGPYRFKERRPDQYLILTRHEAYSARTEPASGYGGRRQARIEELRFIPVPNTNTRVEGVLSGQFEFADQLGTDMLSRIEKNSAQVTPLILPSFGFAYIVFNTRQGVLANTPLRQAVQLALGEMDMLEAAFGDKRFYLAEGSHFPKGTPFHSMAGAQAYNRKDAKKAQELATKAGYKGEVIRILTSRQYEFHYAMAQVMAEQLKAAGLQTELVVVDWATLVQRRGDAKLWDIYMTHSGLLPEPMLSPPQLGDGAPGWWETPAKKKVLTSFNGETDPQKRAKAWGDVQQLVYEEVPYINLGKFASLSARSNRLKGFAPSIWPFFWNAEL